MKKFFFKLHRKLSLFLAAPVLLWALSGLLHPIMANWMRPSIENKWLPPNPLTVDTPLLSPAQALKGIPKLNQLNLVLVNGEPSYRFVTPDQQLHFRSATSGAELTDATHQLSEELARSYLGDNTSPLSRLLESIPLDLTTATSTGFSPPTV
jgi:hypothetical protein